MENRRDAGLEVHTCLGEWREEAELSFLALASISVGGSGFPFAWAVTSEKGSSSVATLVDTGDFTMHVFSLHKDHMDQL